MTQRQHLHAGADLHTRGASCNGTGDRQRCGADRPLGCDMNLGQPHRVETPAFGRFDLLERLGESRRLARPWWALKFMKHAELERHRPLLPLNEADTLGAITWGCQSRDTLIRTGTDP